MFSKQSSGKGFGIPFSAGTVSSPKAKAVRLSSKTKMGIYLIVEELWTSVKPRDSQQDMPVEFRFEKHIALGQKSEDDPGPYGQGFNYRVEAGFRSGEEPEKHLDEVLKAIDHRHLGLDFRAIGEPTTANICLWIFDRLKERGCAVTEVVLRRGDGLTASCRD